MKVYEISSKDYNLKLPADAYIFNASYFHAVNKSKVDKVHYIIGADSKERFIFSFGELDKKFLAPFSSPFSNPISLKKNFSVEQAYGFVKGFIQYAKSNNAKSIDIYLPPSIYDFEFDSKFSNCLVNNGFKIEFLDINYSFLLNSINVSNYIETIEHNARKNLKKSIDSNLEFYKCELDSDKKLAYSVIEKNRKSRGFPLRMTYNQIETTNNVVNINYFLVKKDNQAIASAIVYDVCSDIALVVYWGNLVEYEEFRPINFLSYNLIQYYINNEYRILDIGISTEYGVPNYGLCNFKESIGCIASTKSKFHIDLQY